MKRLAFLVLLLTAWFCIPAHAQFNGCSSFCGTSSSAIADAPGFNNIQASGGGSTLACTYTPVTSGTQNVAYTGATPSASGGVPAYTFSETGALPTGLSINTSTGVISGTPSVNGSFPSIQVKVTDTASTVANCGASFTLVISAPSFVGAGDVTPNAVAWVGLRAYSAAKRGTKIANVCNSTGGVDVGCADLLSDASTGNLVAATVSGITCPGTNCTVKTLYDQTGNNNCAGSTACDVTNATVAKRPTLVANCIGTLPCMTFSTQALESAAAPSVAIPFTISSVEKYTGSGVGIIVFDTNNGSQIRYTNNTTLTLNNSLSATISANSNTAVQSGFLSATTGSVYINGSLTSGAMTNGLIFSGNIVIGGTDNTGSNPFLGNGFEFGIWAGDQTANNSAMNANQRAYWGF